MNENRGPGRYKDLVRCNTSVVVASKTSEGIARCEKLGIVPYGDGELSIRHDGVAVEWLELNENGFGLTYRFELDDPEFLAAPLAGVVQWTYRPDLTYEAVPCDAENARRFLE